MSTRHIAAEHVRLSDLTPQGSSGQASKRFRQKLAADGFTVDKGFKLKPGYLYTVVRAISARVNQNYDGWPSDELKKSYKTFIGKPVFVNHENHDPTKARGVVVAARYVENGPDRYIEVVQEVDAERFPKLAHEIKTGGLDSVSMGAEAGFTICSYCHNKATDTDDMCDHVLNHKGKTLTRFDRRTGKKEDVLVFESCHKISFFELSYVFEPADETAVASKVVVAGKYTKEDFAAAGGKKPWETEDDDDAAAIEIQAMMRTADDSAASPVLPDAATPTSSSAADLGNTAADAVMQGTAGGAASGAAAKATEMVKSNAGSPYEYGGNGKGGQTNTVTGQPSQSYDCTGVTGDVYNSLTGQETGQQHKTTDSSGKTVDFTTMTDMESLGFRPGTQPGAFNVGVNPKPGKDGHTSGELGGVGFESSSSDGVEYGPGARSVNSFPQQWYLPGTSATWSQPMYDKVMNAYGQGQKQSSRQDSADEAEIHAMFHTAGGICLPGQPCMSRIPQGEQITKDSPNNPVNQVSSDPNGTGGRGGGGAAGGGGGAGSSPSKFDIAQWKSADDYAKAMSGKPYNYGGAAGDPEGVDCSGYMSDIYSIYSGKPTRFTTDSDFAALGFKPGYKDGAFNIGTDGGVGTGGHMAGTLPDGTKVESNGSAGVQYGGSAIGAQDFSQQWHYPVSSTPAVPATGVAPTTRAASIRQADLEINPLNSRRTQRDNTIRTYRKVHDFFDRIGAPSEGGTEGVLDYGAGKGHSSQWGHTYEPHPQEDENGVRVFEPTYLEPGQVPAGKFHRVTNIHVLNVVPPQVRHSIVEGIGKALAPGGHAVIVTRSRNDVDSTANKVSADHETGDVGGYRINPGTDQETYQKGFTPDELHQYVSERLGPGYTVSKLMGKDRLSAPGVHVIKHPAAEVTATRRKVRSAALKKIARSRAQRLAWGETEAPMAVDTLREEGTAPEDDDDDFERYVDPPKDLQTPDLAEAGQVDREQEMAGASADQMGGVPGPAEQPAPGVPQAPQQQYMTLQIPMPSEAPQVPQQAAPPVAAPMPPQDPAMQQQGPPQQIAASLLDYFDNYYGRRVANWLDAIEAGRDLNPAEAADYRRQAEKLSTLENGRDLSTTNRNPTKGTATMARSTIASRSTVARAGRRQHFAEGPLVDGGERGRNDQGEQEEAFISQTPPPVAGEYPDEDTTDITNTEHNLVARVQRGRDQLLRDAQQLASLRQRRAFDEAGGPTAEVVDPKVLTGPEGEALTGDNFVSADPNDGVVPTNPKDASLRAFQAFDSWLAQKTGSSSRRHSEATIKKAAAQFSREAGISPQALFPALGIVLREARKNDKQANLKGAKMRKRSNESLDVAAPDGRIDVEAPVENVTSAEAQASQFDTRAFGDNAGDDVAKPDLSTDQNWAPGEASGKKASIKTAGGLLAMRCAEGMIAAGLEPNSRERKYQLAAEFENMNRGLIQDRVALLERFAAVRQADLRRVASGSSRGAARSPIPAGLGGGTRTAAAGPRLAAHDPSNDSSLFI